jgi:hypothetical protein
MSLVLGLRGNTGFLWFFKPRHREKLVLHTGSTPLVCVSNNVLNQYFEPHKNARLKPFSELLIPFQGLVKTFALKG